MDTAAKACRGVVTCIPRVASRGGRIPQLNTCRATGRTIPQVAQERTPRIPLTTLNLLNRPTCPRPGRRCCLICTTHTRMHLLGKKFPSACRADAYAYTHNNNNNTHTWTLYAHTQHTLVYTSHYSCTLTTLYARCQHHEHVYARTHACMHARTHARTTNARTHARTHFVNRSSHDVDNVMVDDAHKQDQSRPVADPVVLWEDTVTLFCLPLFSCRPHF